MLEKPEYEMLEQSIKSEQTAIINATIRIKKEQEERLKKESEQKDSSDKMEDVSQPSTSLAHSQDVLSSNLAQVKLDDDDADDITLSSVTVRGSRSVLVSGRICYDHRENEQKFIDGKICWLEGERELSEGKRVLLKLDALKSCAFFPGQNIILRGVNASGDAIVVEDCIIDASLPKYQMDIRNVRRYNQSLGSMYITPQPLDTYLVSMFVEDWMFTYLCLLLYLSVACLLLTLILLIFLVYRSSIKCDGSCWSIYNS
jgi:hypothetical protein